MISIVIPFKYDSNHRIENLLELIDYIKKYWDFGQLIVSEMDVSPKVLNLLPAWVDYIFAKEAEDSAWSRSKRVNLSMPIIKKELTMILDSDLIVDKDCIKLATEKIIKDEIDAVTPFEKAYHFPRKLIIEEMKKKEIKTNNFCLKEKYSRSFIANGGCFITKTSIFKHLRGMNELFLGWGLEDDELINRYLKLGYRYGKINSASIHINHERTKNCELDFNNFNNSLIEKNRCIISSKSQILNYFGITEQVGLYSTINKPLPIDSQELFELVEKEKQAYSSLKSEPYEV